MEMTFNAYLLPYVVDPAKPVAQFPFSAILVAFASTADPMGMAFLTRSNRAMTVF